MKFITNYFTLFSLLPCLINASDDWGYEQHNGPDKWGSINQAYKACKEGKRQSPIALNDFKSDFITHEKYVSEWQNTKNKLAYINNGHAISVDLSSVKVPSFKLDCTELHLKQFHVHTPAEHTINGKRADLEAHFVFTDDKSSKFQVFGVLFNHDSLLGNHQGFFKGITESHNSLKHKGDKREFNGLDLGSLYEQVHGFQSGHVYQGSLTTPPCTETARFIISNKILPISYHQLNIFKHAFQRANNRPIQNTTDFHKVGIFENKQCAL